MKKLTVKALALLLALTLSVGSVSAFAYYEPNITEDEIFFIEDIFDDENFTAIMEAHAISIFGHAFMENHNRSLATIATLYSFLPQNRAGKISYPENFGGLYIDGNGNLVVLNVTRPMAFSDDASISVFVNTLGYMQDIDHGVIIRNVDFSYNELMEVIHFLGEFHELFPEIAFRNASGWHLDLPGNRVVINLIDLSEEEIALFRNEVIDSPALVFQQSLGRYSQWYEPYLCSEERTLFEYESIAPLSISLNIGQQIQTLSTIAASIGYRARSNITGMPGFVTAAHAGDPHPMPGLPLTPYHRFNVMDERGRLIGRMTHNRYFSLNVVDAMFVELAGATLSDQIPHHLRPPCSLYVSPNIVPALAGSRMGQVVFLIGTTVGGNTELRTGRVAITNITETRWHPEHGFITLTYDGVNFNDRLWGGMSGGIVFSRFHDLTLFRFGVTGIAVLALPGNSGGIIRAENINRRLELSFN